MPRPKGSKNKKKLMPIEDIEAKIAEISAEIDTLTEQRKAKKAELKKLLKEKEAHEAAAAAAKLEEEKKTILDALQKSGKSLEEILTLLK